MFEALSLLDYCCIAIAAAGIGISKSGFAGFSMLHVVLLAWVFGAKNSTGVLLPMLVIGDVMAIGFFGKKVDWHHVVRLLPPTCLGVIVGAVLLGRLDEATFRPTIGAIILVLTCIQVARIWRPNLLAHVPHQRWFAWALGILAGITTMMANAAGPVVALYLLAVSLPKLQFVGTSAWFFLTINVFKLPFSYTLGFISWESLLLDMLAAPMILAGMLVGRWMVHRIAQKLFDSLLLAFTALAALQLMGVLKLAVRAPPEKPGPRHALPADQQAPPTFDASIWQGDKGDAV
ncbi:MAG: sulfite exporter TauE/SafE family protein [Planctomycetota bacterium]|nr:MAG: sulfite exporter TauE/SafE family protein [Planctomycetota bacterium]